MPPKHKSFAFSQKECHVELRDGKTVVRLIAWDLALSSLFTADVLPVRRQVQADATTDVLVLRVDDVDGDRLEVAFMLARDREGYEAMQRCLAMSAEVLGPDYREYMIQVILK
jgi:hypothetical protein